MRTPAELSSPPAEPDEYMLVGPDSQKRKVSYASSEIIAMARKFLSNPYGSNYGRQGVKIVNEDLNPLNEMPDILGMLHIAQNLS